jgi:hypothetical protein
MGTNCFQLFQRKIRASALRHQDYDQFAKYAHESWTSRSRSFYVGTLSASPVSEKRQMEIVETEMVKVALSARVSFPTPLTELKTLDSENGHSFALQYRVSSKVFFFCIPLVYLAARSAM